MTDPDFLEAEFNRWKEAQEEVKRSRQRQRAFNRDWEQDAQDKWWERARYERFNTRQGPRANTQQGPEANIFNRDLCERLQGKAVIVNAYNKSEFKDFFNRSLNRENTQKLLQLEDHFSEKDLKAAYKKWALILHPDKHVEQDIKDVAEILFKEVLFKARLDLESKIGVT